MMANKISVIIIFHGRIVHLLNVLNSLEKGLKVPDEVILVEMDESFSALPEYNLNIKCKLIDKIDTSNLPLAKARNEGANLASFDTLVFLDVDCIPSQNFIAEIHNFKVNPSALYMCKPLYLALPVENVENFEFTEDAIEHPHRPTYTEVVQTQDYGLFWSLCFFISSQIFFELGGFDEQYKGYGAEDTDFSFKCQNQNIPFFLTSHEVYHQQHNFIRPPLNSIISIVRNSNYFYSKWNIWPMKNHLEEFKSRNFIEWSEDKIDKIRIFDYPDKISIKNSLVANERYA